MNKSSRVLYFGDQSAVPYASLADLLKREKTSILLASFLRSSLEAIQEEIGSATLEERSLFHTRRFDQILDHVIAQNIRHVAVTSVLCCVNQLGWLLLYRERVPDDWSSTDLASVGVCTGCLTATVAAVACSDGRFLRFATYIVRVSLRLGLEASRRSLALDASSGPWSTTVSGLALETMQDELRKFNHNQNVPILKQVYLSAWTTSSVTISGPPGQLAAFLSQGPLHTARKLPLPIFGAFHAAHLPLPDLNRIISQSEFLDLTIPEGRLFLPHVSTTTELKVGDVLKTALTDCLQSPMDINDIFHRLCQQARDSNVWLVTFGPAYVRNLCQQLRPTEVVRQGSGQGRLSRDEVANIVGCDSIAVVGMAGRFPGAENVEELWKILTDGEDLHGLIPPDRFDLQSHVDKTGKTRNTSLTPFGCFYDGVANFDTALFKMSPREATQTDPAQRLMLLTAYEALEMAGYYDNGDEKDRPKYGTFYGAAGDDYRQVNSGQDIDVNYITGGIRAFGPGRVSYYLGWEGPSMSLDAACSASAVAIHQAIISLQRRECDLALAGGANLLTNSDMFAGLSRARFVCSTGPCKTFDETADGYCRADGFATVVMKRLDDAIRGKDNILGVIRAAETSHAGTALSLTHPDADTQLALFRSVLSSAGLAPDDIDHIEMHGTGTQAGDLAEATSVAGLIKASWPRDRPLTISSMKPNVGHSEAASGVSSLIKGLLMLQNKMIPRHIGIKTRLNPKLPPLEELNIIIPPSNMPYLALNRDETRRMLVNNFNATGGITTMLLEEFHSQPISQVKDPREFYPITLSAASHKALRRSEARLLQHLQAREGTDMSHLSYTLTARRVHHKHRFGCVVKSRADLIRMLESQTKPSPVTAAAQNPRGRPCPVFVFTGQTSTLAQAKTLFETDAVFRDHLCRFDQMCRSMSLPSFLGVVQGQESNVYRPVQKQLGLVALEISLAMLLQSWGIYPKGVIGHSLGEYAALCVSEMLSVADVLWLVGKRGLLLEAKCLVNAYSMAVVALPVQETRDALRETSKDCEISCVNAPQQTVVSGKDEDIDALVAHLKSMKTKAVKIKIAFAFHSKQMDVITDDYLDISRCASFRNPSVPFASTLLGEVVEDASTLGADYLARQTRGVVRFQDALLKLEAFLESGDQDPFWIELGPSPACSPMMASSLSVRPDDMAATLDPRQPNWSTMSNVILKLHLRGGNVRWDEYHKQHLDALQLLQLPSYPFDLERYWMQYNGDWVIRKDQQPKTPPSLATGSLMSSSLHRFESHILENGVRKLTFATDTDVLNSSGTGPMLALPVYVDMAMAATSHLCKLSGQLASAVSLTDTVFSRPPVGSSSSTSPFRTTAAQCFTDTQAVNVTITSPTFAGQSHDLLHCKAILGNSDEWASEAQRTTYLYQSRIDLLQLLLAHGHSKRLSGLDVCALIPEHDEACPTGIEGVLLNTHTLEAAATVTAQHGIEGYLCNPQWLKALIDVPLILLHASNQHRYDCVGWSSMRLLQPVQACRRYKVHVRVQPLDAGLGMMEGDIHALDEDDVSVAVITRIAYRTTASEQLNNDGKEHVSDSSTENRDAPFTNHLLLRKMPHRLSSPKEPERSTVLTNGFTKHESLSSSEPVSHAPKPPTSKDSQAHTPAPAITFEHILRVIAKELGVEASSLTDNTVLEDLGVDSIIQISIVAELQPYFTDRLPSGLLMQYNNVAKLRDFLVPKMKSFT